MEGADMGLKPSKLRKALNAKGFQQRESGNHEQFIFYYNDEKTDIWTQMSRGSHGSRELGEPNVNQMKKQMHFETKEQLIQFSVCSFSEDDYIKMLIRNGKLEKGIQYQE